MYINIECFGKNLCVPVVNLWLDFVYIDDVDSTHYLTMCLY